MSILTSTDGYSIVLEARLQGQVFLIKSTQLNDGCYLVPPSSSAGASHALHWLPCRTPTLLIASGEDRLLPSLTEAVRLQSLLPSAQRVVLPDSGHTALLEVRQPLATGHALLQATGTHIGNHPDWGGLLCTQH